MIVLLPLLILTLLILCPWRTWRASGCEDAVAASPRSACALRCDFSCNEATANRQPSGIQMTSKMQRTCNQSASNFTASS